MSATTSYFVLRDNREVNRFKAWGGTNQVYQAFDVPASSVEVQAATDNTIQLTKTETSEITTVTMAEGTYMTNAAIVTAMNDALDGTDYTAYTTASYIGIYADFPFTWDTSTNQVPWGFVLPLTSSLSSFSLTVSEGVSDTISLTATETGVVSEHVVFPGTYSTIDSLIEAMNIALTQTDYTAYSSGQEIGIEANHKFTWNNTGTDLELDYTLPITVSGGEDIDTVTISVPFYPPSMISDRNVFMRLVDCNLNTKEIESENTAYTENFLISIINLSQPCGTFSDTLTNSCTRSQVLGMYSTVQSFSPRGNILTHIPDGLQELTFKIQLWDNVSINVPIGFLFTLGIQFEVAGTK